MYCAHCGSQVDDEGKFCGNCGKPVSNAPAKINDAPVPVTATGTLYGIHHLYEGRIGRLDWFFGVILSFFVFIAVIAILAVAMGSSNGDFFVFLLILLYVVFFYFTFSLHARRLHDINQSGWKSLLFIIPIVNLIMLVWLISAKGVDAGNEYGGKTTGGFFKRIFNRT